MRKSIATIIRKLADWLDPQPTATPDGAGGTPEAWVSEGNL